MENTGNSGIADGLPGDETSRRLAGSLARLEAIRRHRRQGGLGAADMRLLWLLMEAGPQTLSEITGALSLERSTVNRQVNAAVDAGLLGKERVAGSSAYRIFLTANGREAFVQGAGRALTAIDDALAEMGTEDAAVLVNLVERFVSAYGVGNSGELVP